jgi:hypothetical protein
VHPNQHNAGYITHDVDNGATPLSIMADPPLSLSTNDNDDDNNIKIEKPLTLRVSGLGHTLTFDVPASASVLDVKAHIETLTSLPCPYQRLLSRGKKLDQDNATLSSCGILDRTKLMLLHNELYTNDKEGIAALLAIEQEVTQLSEAQRRGYSTDKDDGVALHEAVTRICCKLDAVEIHGSEYLRSMRKKILAKAEALENKQ